METGARAEAAAARQRAQRREEDERADSEQWCLARQAQALRRVRGAQRSAFDGGDIVTIDTNRAVERDPREENDYWGKMIGGSRRGRRQMLRLAMSDDPVGEKRIEPGERELQAPLKNLDMLSLLVPQQASSI